MLKDVVFSLYLILIPLFLTFAEKRWAIVRKISPMVILYVIGLVVGNTGMIGEPQYAICTNVSNVTVLLAIPLMLLSCDFKKWSIGSSLKAFVVGIVCVAVVTVLGFFIFRGPANNAGLSDMELAKVSGSMMGIYSGGIPNFAPVSKAVGLPQNLFLLISGYDLIVTGCYLILIVFFGKPLIRKIFKNVQHNEYDATLETESRTMARPSVKGLLNRLFGVVAAVAIVAVSYLVAMLFHLENPTTLIIILITTISIICSFVPVARKLEGTFDSGLFFVYVFCLSVATMVNIHDMDLSKYLFILYYIAFAVFGSLILQIIAAKILKIDGDLTLAASISLINSPPFVPMVAAALNNRDVILPGIAIGLLGYAAGNYLGIGVYILLSML